MQRFVAQDLSSFYFHRVKDRLYCDAASDLRRRSAVTALCYVLNVLKDTIAPIVPVLASEIEDAACVDVVGDSFRRENREEVASWKRMDERGRKLPVL